MERTLNVKGCSLGTMIFNGVAFLPKQQFELKMTEKEYNCYKDFIRVDSIKEIEEPKQTKSEPIVEVPKKEIEEPKGEKDGQPITNSRNKVSSKKQIQLS